MNRIKNLLLSLLTGSIILSQTACVKEIDEYQDPAGTNGPVTDINQLQIPAGFSYDIEKNVSLQLNLKTNTDAPIPGVRINILSDLPENGGKILFTGISNSSGQLTGNFKVQKSTTQVIVNTNYIGLPNNAIAGLQSNSINMTLGGSNPNRIQANGGTKSRRLLQQSGSRISAVPTKTYIGNWDSQGVPSYLASGRDALNTPILKRLNSNLPDNRPVPVYHPQYLTNTSAIEVQQNSDIWITFIHEGTINRNSLGYYTYPKNNPPANTADISSIKIAFPNLSYRNSGGGLVSGDKVYLGSFSPDSAIGFVILTDAYDISSATVGNGTNQYYTNETLNPETTPSGRHHHVLLWDSTEQKMILGFEDQNRNSGNDDDFNDLVFHLTANTTSGFNTANLNRAAGPIDTDGDGVEDLYDEYPYDAELAYNSYYPSETTFGYLAYEDLWPYRGDYDMNDMLIGYRYNLIKNANNDIKEIQSKVFVKAAGGSYQHGFGIEFPVPGYFVETVNGPLYTENYISVNANGTEAGQNTAVVVVFDNSNNVAPRPVGYYVNTEPGSPVITSDTIRLAVRFVSGIPPATLGDAPFNPFLISNKRRGYEIHLPDKPPTSLADYALFNTGQDRSNVAMGRYYKSDNNLPWCLNIPAAFPIITEKTSILNAYLKFGEWVQSGGTLYPDWYEDKPGYRDYTKLLNR